MYQTGESSEVKSVYCSFNGPELGSSHTLSSSQPPGTPAPVELTSLSGHHGHPHTCVYTHTHTNKKKSLKTYKILAYANYCIYPALQK